MAVIETWLRCDLTQTVQPVTLDGNLFTSDSGGNRIGVEVFRNGSPVSLTGTVSAKVLLSDGTQVTLSGSRSGNRASVVLTSACYAVPGNITVTIKLTETSGTVTTLGCAICTVYSLGGGT